MKFCVLSQGQIRFKTRKSVCPADRSYKEQPDLSGGREVLDLTLTETFRVRLIICLAFHEHQLPKQQSLCWVAKVKLRLIRMTSLKAPRRSSEVLPFVLGASFRWMMMMMMVYEMSHGA
jgi:hypothetical protein